MTEARIEIRIIARHPPPPPSGLTSTVPNLIWTSGPARAHLASAQAREPNVRELLREDVCGAGRTGTTRRPGLPSAKRSEGCATSWAGTKAGRRGGPEGFAQASDADASDGRRELTDERRRPASIAPPLSRDRDRG